MEFPMKHKRNIFNSLGTCEVRIVKISDLELVSLISKIGLGKDFSLKLTILLCDLHIEVLTFVEYNLYV